MPRKPNTTRNTGYDADQIMKVSVAERLAALEAPPERTTPRLVDSKPSVEQLRRRENWKRIFEPRVAALLEKMELIQPLADRSRYFFTENDWNKTRNVIMDKLAETDDVFKRGRGRIGAFHLDDDDGEGDEA